MTEPAASPGASNNIRSLRVRAGLTQCELADRMRVAQATVSRWECGEGSKHSYNRVKEELTGLLETRKSGPFLGNALAVCWPDLVRFFRAARNISQEELAYRLQSSTDSISRWERGLFRPDFRAQVMLRDLFLSPLEKDSDIQRLATWVGSEQRHVSLHYGPLTIALSQPLQGKNEDHGHDVGLFSNIAKTRDGKFRDFWHASCQNGFTLGEVPMCRGYWELAGGDQRKILGLPVGQHGNSVLWVCVHQSCNLADEKKSDGDFDFLHADQLIG